LTYSNGHQEKKRNGEISFEEADLELHAKDASLFYVKPAMIIYPKDKFDIVQIVKYVAGLKGEVSITVRAAGTCMSGGSLNNSIILDVTKYLNKIGGFDVKNKNIVCEPGVYFRDLEEVLDKKNLMFPSYPASKDLCCVGGMVANNSAGEKTLLYGQTKDWVEEIEMVLSDGTIHNFKKLSFKEVQDFIYGNEKGGFLENIYFEVIKLIELNKQEVQNSKPKVSKNSSGYNLWDVIDFENETVDICKLIVGSQGTLGIITCVKLKLVQKPKYSQMMTVMLPDLKNLVAVVEEILKSKPESLESFDDHTFVVAMRFLPTILWKMKGNIFQLALSFIPEMWMALTGGIPKIILLAEFTGSTQAEANKKANNALKNFQKIYFYKARVTKNETDISKYWTFRRESFNLLRSKMAGFRTAPFVEDVIVPIEVMREFIPMVQNILDKYNFTYTIAGHAGNGHFHIIPLMKLNSEKEVSSIKVCNQEIFSLVGKLGGSISGEHNDGWVRTPYLHYMFSNNMLNLFLRIKNIFDIKNIFNPNKKVGGSVSNNYTHIRLAK
jgi:FAD/FMN-containing dehydrogenase